MGHHVQDDLPFVLIRKTCSNSDPKFVRHERIHLCQQIELWVLPFMLLYLGNSSPAEGKAFHTIRLYRQITFEKHTGMKARKATEIQTRGPGIYADRRQVHPGNRSR